MSNTATKSVNYTICQLIKKHQFGMSYESRYGMTSRLLTSMKDLQHTGLYHPTY